jgi:putative transposase
MPNHFHFLIKIKEPVYSSPDRVQKPVWAVDPSKQFSNLFNSYAQAYNKRFARHGNLFERPFKRKLIEDREYLKNIVIYIHKNSINHGFTQNVMEYKWSSYFSDTLVTLQLNEVIGWFEGEANFKTAHVNFAQETDVDQWPDLSIPPSAYAEIQSSVQYRSV